MLGSGAGGLVRRRDLVASLLPRDLVRRGRGALRHLFPDRRRPDASGDADTPPPPPPPPPPASPRATGDDDAKRVAATLAANGVPWVSVLEAGGFAKLVDLCAAGAGPRLRDLFPDFDDEAWRRRFDVPLVGGVRVPTSSFGETDLS